MSDTADSALGCYFTVVITFTATVTMTIVVPIGLLLWNFRHSVRDPKSLPAVYGFSFFFKIFHFLIDSFGFINCFNYLNIITIHIILFYKNEQIK